mmetsp:Transcript_38944/g.77311  ORF Transcript_38944/g.77311 Transcript_38944/m.77311 type:complete len:204 (-) Transcript_38944:170-781(-)
MADTGRHWLAQGLLDAVNPRLSKYRHGLLIAVIIVCTQLVLFGITAKWYQMQSARIEYKTTDTNVAIFEVTGDTRICLSYSFRTHQICYVPGSNCSEYDCLGQTPKRYGHPWADDYGGRCSEAVCEGATLVAYAVNMPAVEAASLALAVLGPVEMLLTVTLLSFYMVITRGPRAALDANVYKEISRASLESAPQSEFVALRNE